MRFGALPASSTSSSRSAGRGAIRGSSSGAGFCSWVPWSALGPARWWPVRSSVLPWRRAGRGPSRGSFGRGASATAAVDAELPALALALADALAGGHSLRSALCEATRSLSGAAGHELRRTQGELAAGAPTDVALEAMQARVRSARLDTVVAACLLQRRAGGDLARLLRQTARAMEEEARLTGELRAATAQARFTGLLVVMLPLGGALLAELASPGWFAGLWSSFLTGWLVGIAIFLQVAAAALIRRLGTVRR